MHGTAVVLNHTDLSVRVCDGGDVDAPHLIEMDIISTLLLHSPFSSEFWALIDAIWGIRWWASSNSLPWGSFCLETS